MRPKRVGSLLLAAMFTLLAAACAPTTLPGVDDAALAELQTTAEILYHRMELGHLEAGIYTTNVLVDAPIPEGARWTLQEFASDGSSYLLVLTSSRVEGVSWHVSPDGVSRR